MRLRHGAARVSREAAPTAFLSRLDRARLYFITPDLAPDQVVGLVAAAVRGGAEVVQLRHKALARGALLELARRIRRVVKGGRLFVVNDHVDIALLAGADGVHLGPSDLAVASARELAGEELLIGASASSVDAALEAVRQGADYLGSGPAFATPIKTEKRVIGPEAISGIARAVPVPVFAIGGIEQSNVRLVTAAGVQRICVIRAIAGATDPEQAARTLRAMLEP